MKPLVVEYLVILPKKDTFCDSVKSFTRLLTVDSSLTVHSGKIRYKEDFECEYAITTDDITEKEQRFFHLRFSFEANSQQDVDRFAAFLRTIRTIMNRAGGQPETLWDDISWYYSEKAYELIYSVENLMRKLIANFMLVTIGKEWVTEASPLVVREAMLKSKRKDYLNALHTIDFIDLAGFLLEPYATRSTDDLYASLDNATTTDELEELKAFIPRSNWTRYFSELVDCNDDFIRSRWSELYELRCKVAHNSIIGKTDYERIKALSDEVAVKLSDAITKLPQVMVPPAEVDVLAENAASNLSSLVGEFISNWREVEREMQRIGGDSRPAWSEFHETLHRLVIGNAITAEQVDRIGELRTMRNHLIHPTGLALSEQELRAALDYATLFLRALRQYRPVSQQSRPGASASDKDGMD